MCPKFRSCAIREFLSRNALNEGSTVYPINIIPWLIPTVITFANFVKQMN